MINKYNEQELAEYMIENGFSSNKKFYELSVLSRYLFSKGKKKEEIKNDLILFCDRYFENFNYVKYSATLNKIVNSCGKFKLLQVGSIDITQKEINKCKEVDTEQTGMVFFTLLCLYKISKYFRNSAYINEKYSVIMKMSGVQKRSTLMRILKHLHDNGYIRICINGSIEWTTEIEEDDNIVIHVKDIKNCSLYYKNYLFNGYKECELCGKMIRRISNNKYCSSCAKETERRRKREYYQKNK